MNPFEDGIDEEEFKKYMNKKAKDEKLEKQIQSNAIELHALGIGGGEAIDLENPSQELEEGES